MKINIFKRKTKSIPTDFLGTIKVLGNRWQNPKLLK